MVVTLTTISSQKGRADERLSGGVGITPVRFALRVHNEGVNGSSPEMGRGKCCGAGADSALGDGTVQNEPF
jgi:hypothetical protein